MLTGAPKIVMFHGFASGAGLFALALPALTQQFEVIAVDMPGCGLSPRIPYTPTSTETSEKWYMDAFDAWFDSKEAPTEPVTLLGHSLGGYMSALWAMKSPDRVAHLVLASPVGVPHEPQWTEEQQKHRSSWLWWTLSKLWSNNATPQSLVRLAGPWGRDLTTTIVKKRFSFATLAHPLHVPSLAEYIYQISAAPGSGEWALKYILKPGAWAFNPIGPRMIEAGTTGGFRAPITFLYGSHDWMSPDAALDVAAAVRTAGVDASVHVVQQAGHQIFMENPEGFAGAVIQAAFSKTPALMGPGMKAPGAAFVGLGSAAPAAASAASGADSELSASHAAHIGTEMPDETDVSRQAEVSAQVSAEIAGGPLAASREA